MKWAIALLIAGCGAGSTPPAHGTGPSAPSVDAGAIAAAPLGDRECEALLDHAVAIGVADQRATRPADQLAPDDAQARARAELHDEFAASCRTLSRDDYRCAMAAATLDALAACQAKLSSSTSNTKLAPGGILPPAAPVAP